MKRCPTCGRPVRTIFEHLGEDCQDWPAWTMKRLNVPKSAAADISRTVAEARKEK